MNSYKRTKIVCTIGPSSWDKSTLKELVQAGMNVARLNFSHGSHEEKKQQIKDLRDISLDLDTPLSIIADLQGPKLRLGKLNEEKHINSGELLELSVNPQSDNQIPLQFDLSLYLKEGQRIFLNDGLVALEVLSIDGKVIKTKALNDGVISSNKGVNIPDTDLGRDGFTTKDSEDAKFALSEKVDYLALSFIQKPEDLTVIKSLRDEINPKTKIIAKIEKKKAIENLEAIIAQVDAAMVARGDLAIETSAAEVPIYQQQIINLCRQYQKPVIVATQMLESMITNPRPTRAEASDVASAVLDQVDAVMLSAESASGKYPVEAVKTMSDIITSVEKNLGYKHYIKINWENIEGDNLSYYAISSAAASMSYRLGGKAIVVATVSGRTAQTVSAFRPDSLIIAMTHDEQVRNQLSLVWGVYANVIESEKVSDVFWQKVIDQLAKKELIEKGQKLVMIGGSIGITGETNSIKVVEV